MAAVYPQNIANAHSPVMRQHPVHLSSPQRRPTLSRMRFFAELSQCLYDFVLQLLPTPEELAIKEDVRKLLERLIRTIEPDSRLLSFGSTANGFSLRNSDMDLCCLIDAEERLPATDLVNMLGDLFARETKFNIKPLPHARIPIVKLSLDPKPGLPFGIACDIGFENRLALENTRLLRCYAMIDPARVRTLVLFLKVWCKRRKINSPYKGTLSSYGYVLLVIYFLVHVKNPPVLPNLQQMPPLRPITPEETQLNGHNIWFFDDIDLLRERWQSSNNESVAELLMDFFRFYSREFNYNFEVVSIRAGLILKDSKGWDKDPDRGTARERNRLCIEDPFETDFNVARCVTRDGLYTIRGEFMRASKILASRPERAIYALAQLCEERKDEELLHASPSRSNFMPPRLSTVPRAAQTPYTIGSNPMRPAGAPEPDRLSPPEVHQVPSLASAAPIEISADHPEHMGPKRAKWTSPPPPEAPEADRSAFEQRFGQSLAQATSSIQAREHDRDTTSSSNNSDIVTDEDDLRSVAGSDDARSVRSFTEGASPRWTNGLAHANPSPQGRHFVDVPSTSRNSPRMQFVQTEGGDLDPRWFARLRGRPPVKAAPFNSDTSPSLASQRPRQEPFVPPPRMDNTRRATSGPAHPVTRHSMSALPTLVTPTSIYPSRAHALQQPSPQRANNVFYETSPHRERAARQAGINYAMPVARLPSFGRLEGVPRADTSSQCGALPSPRHLRLQADIESGATPPLSTTPSQATVSLPYNRLKLHSHSHSHSQSTILAPTPPPPEIVPPTSSSQCCDAPLLSLSSPSRSRPGSSERACSPHTYQDPVPDTEFRCGSPFATISSTSGSPNMSCSSSQYAPSVSPLSTSPPSPHSETFSEPIVKLSPSPISGRLGESSVSSVKSTVQLAHTEDKASIAVVDQSTDDNLASSTGSLSLGS